MNTLTHEQTFLPTQVLPQHCVSATGGLGSGNGLRYISFTHTSFLLYHMLLLQTMVIFTFSVSYVNTDK